MISSLRLAARKSALKSASASFSSTAAAQAGLKNVVVVAGTRIPFATTTSIYMDEMAVDLQRLAISGLLTQTALPKDAVDYVICGSVRELMNYENGVFYVEYKHFAKFFFKETNNLFFLRQMNRIIGHPRSPHIQHCS
jgi:Thiolase, N-terminal domain